HRGARHRRVHGPPRPSSLQGPASQRRSPVTDATPTVAQLERMYEVMARITTCDERVRAEVKAGTLQAAFYPVRGLEAVCGAMSLVLERRDHLVSTYRNFGDAMAKGLDLRAVMAEA